MRCSMNSASSTARSTRSPKPDGCWNEPFHLHLVTGSPSIGYTACTDGLAIPEEKREQRGWQARLSTSFAYASLVCALSFWLAFALYYLKVPGWGWINSLTAVQWVLFEAFALLLAIVATASGLPFGAKLWRIALPVALLMFLLSYCVMVT